MAEIFNKAQLDSVTFGDTDLQKEVVGLFFDNLRQALEALQGVSSDDEAAQLKFWGHSVKGAALSIGAERCAELAKQIESQQLSVKAAIEQLQTASADLKTALTLAGLIA